MVKKYISVLVSIFLFLLSLSACGGNKKIVTVKPQSPSAFTPDETWELTFFDDFDGDALDRTRWHYAYGEEGVRRGGWWVDDAVFVENGNLVIRTDYREHGKFGAGWYTGAIETSALKEEAGNALCDGFSQAGGYFEVRCKVPATYGNWAAFWLMPDSNFANDTFGTGVDGAEIDIFESPFMCWTDHPNMVSHAIHIDGYGDELKSIGSDYMEIENLYTEFHTFALLWDDSGYTFYIDGRKTWHTKDALDTVSAVSSYLLLSCEVAGVTEDGVPFPGQQRGENGEWVTNWAGTPADNDLSQPYDFVVDYVKVYAQRAHE